MDPHDKVSSLGKNQLAKKTPRTRSVSPAPFLVSHDTFIRQATIKESETEKVQNRVAVQRKLDMDQPVFIVEPPTPGNDKSMKSIKGTLSRSAIF